ncbi:hypothetical protein AXF42_Ash004043 [Apostasia shenzhenica]|uniref:Uncharacterized protein n=1 Tax=Apostasia shenzhenica TaxID=1088818 RepID=A0A2I0A1V7_9ASPA|nr:hypothetical protein AXF42_Ash004043 [Apostasia shenzhenica]
MQICKGRLELSGHISKIGCSKLLFDKAKDQMCVGKLGLLQNRTSRGHYVGNME